MSTTTREQILIQVLFEATDGTRWGAIGGGDTLADAMTFARASAPERFRRVIRISDVYGE